MRASHILAVALGGTAVAAMAALTPMPAAAFEVQRVQSSRGITAWLAEGGSE
jgi:hypothetical protein